MDASFLNTVGDWLSVRALFKSGAAPISACVARRRLFTATICAIALFSYAETVVYPRPESSTDARADYPVKLLRLALSKTHNNFELKPSDVLMDQGRALTELGKSNGAVNIVWSMTSIDREKDLLPIRIPIYKGLIGWRIPLVLGERYDVFGAVKSIEGIKHFTAGQGHDWPDTSILRANGITVIDSPSYEGLFTMLVHGRFDYFPRSIVEIWPEAEAHRRDGIMLDPNIIIRYPTAFYYFVNTKNTKLAETVRVGLEAAISDGSFDKLFYQNYAALIERANPSSRTIIDIKNPLLPPATPIDRPELWFRASDITKLAKP